MDCMGCSARRRVSKKDPCLWYSPLERHYIGEFSFAALKNKQVIEAESQVEVGEEATFVGLYDGHGGTEVSTFLNQNLFKNLMDYARDNHNTISEQVIRSAIKTTENQFLTEVMAPEYQRNPVIAAVGSSCLIGVVWRNTIYVANLGDSRAVVAYKDSYFKSFSEWQMSMDHNVANHYTRQELKAKHPRDPTIVVADRATGGSWKVKGLIQTTNSIGDAYLKQPLEYPVPDNPRYQPRYPPLDRGVLSSEPYISKRVLKRRDRFLIFGSAGLWNVFSNQVAIDFVQKHKSRNNVAKRLVQEALRRYLNLGQQNAAYEPLIHMENREDFHPSITVVVLFLDYHKKLKSSLQISEVSVKGWVDADAPSQFSIMRNTDQGSSPRNLLLSEVDVAGTSRTKKVDSVWTSRIKKLGRFWPFRTKKKVQGELPGGKKVDKGKQIVVDDRPPEPFEEAGPSFTEIDETTRPSDTMVNETAGPSSILMDVLAGSPRTMRDEPPEPFRNRGRYRWASLKWGKLQKSKSNPLPYYFFE